MALIYRQHEWPEWDLELKARHDNDKTKANEGEHTRTYVIIVAARG